MNILIRATEKQKKDFLTGLPVLENVIFVNNFSVVAILNNADAIIDLMFDDDPSTLPHLQLLLPKPIIINSVIHTLSETNKNFIRINGWEGFLNKPILEGSFLNEEYKLKAEAILAILAKKIQWLPDQPGFISPRIISMIINEAYLALHERVSTKKEIDTAMKMGTGYPLGPFEWSELIGVDKIKRLLQSLEKTDPKYSPEL